MDIYEDILFLKIKSLPICLENIINNSSTVPLNSTICLCGVDSEIKIFYIMLTCDDAVPVMYVLAL
jgi:hypothetical protein